MTRSRGGVSPDHMRPELFLGDQPRVALVPVVAVHEHRQLGKILVEDRAVAFGMIVVVLELEGGGRHVVSTRSSSRKVVW